MADEGGPLRNSRDLSEWLRLYGHKGGAGATGLPIEAEVQPVILVDEVIRQATPLPYRNAQVKASVTGGAVTPSFVMQAPQPGGLLITALRMIGTAGAQVVCGWVPTNPLVGPPQVSVVPAPTAELPSRVTVAQGGSILIPPQTDAAFIPDNELVQGAAAAIRVPGGGWFYIRSAAVAQTTFSVWWSEFEAPTPEP